VETVLLAAGFTQTMGIHQLVVKPHSKVTHIILAAEFMAYSN